jgi:leucyl aminopeptidase (aminopeptidase T)
MPLIATPEMTARFAEVAPQLVRSSKVGRGMTVLIRGHAAMMPLMERLAIELERAGAFTMLIPTSDSISAVNLAAPASQRLRGVATMVPLMNSADMIFTFPMVEDFAIYANRSPELLKTDAVVDSTWRAMRRTTERRGREVVVNVPLPRDTVGVGLSYADLASLRWGSMSVDYPQVAATGDAIRRQLDAARQIRVTSPEGTDITFTLVKGRVAVEAGTSTPVETSRKGIGSALPGGTVFAIAEPSSASGAIRAPWDWCELPVENEAIDVDHGRPTNITASRDEACIRKTVSPLRFNLLTIGLNRANRSATSGVHAPLNDLNGTGMVLLGFGLNTFAGGSDTTRGQWMVPQPRASVYADGVPVVRDGALVVPQLEARRRP